MVMSCRVTLSGGFSFSAKEKGVGFCDILIFGYFSIGR
jgi:hypothetical protein